MPEERISWEEAEWTRQALGMHPDAFARLLAMTPAQVFWGQQNPQAFLSPAAAKLLKAHVSRIQVPGGKTV